MQPAQQAQSVTGENDTVSKSADKVAAFKANWKYGGNEQTLGSGTFQTLTEVLKVTD